MELTKQTILFYSSIAAAAVFLFSFSQWKTAVKCAVIVCLLEGAIRKWVLPQGQEVVYMLKDIFLAGAYAKFFLFPDPSIRQRKVNGSALLLWITAAIVSLSALNPNINSIGAAVMGLKIYLFYIPLAFMIPHLFKNEDDMIKNLSWLALIAIPICLLGVVQFFSPTFSVINTYAERTEEMAEGLGIAAVGDRVRITGTFPYITGMTTFLTVFTALGMYLLTTPKTKFLKTILVVVLPLLAANGLMTGSRAAVLGQGIVVAGFLVAASVTRLSNSRNAMGMAMVSLMLVGLMSMLFFQDAAQTFWSRAGTHGAREELNRRLWYPIDATLMGFEEGGFAGYGIGTTHPAAQAVRRFLGDPNQIKQAPYYESEPGQVAIELGWIGFFAWYVMRFALFFGTFSSFMKCPPGHWKSLILISLLFQGIHLHVQFVYNHTANLYCWLIYGLGLIPLTQSTVYKNPATAKITPLNRRIA